MRISADKDDPGYANLDHRAQIFVDGKELKEVITADEEQVIAIVVKRGWSGKILTAGDQIARTTIKGCVEIRIPE